jgi:hypothetical protein
VPEPTWQGLTPEALQPLRDAAAFKKIQPATRKTIDEPVAEAAGEVWSLPATVTPDNKRLQALCLVLMAHQEASKRSSLLMMFSKAQSSVTQTVCTCSSIP